MYKKKTQVHARPYNQKHGKSCVHMVTLKSVILSFVNDKLPVNVFDCSSEID